MDERDERRVAMKMINKGSVIILALILMVVSVQIASAARSGVITGAYVGCTSKDYLSEFIGYSIEQDWDGMNALLNRVCFNLNGQRYSLIDAGFLTSKVRVYAGGSSIILWVTSEAVR